MADIRRQIEDLLRERFSPQSLTVQDDSGRHAGHAGALGGGGHFKVELVAAEFEGLSLVEQQRRVYEALRSLFPHAVHALALKTAAPAKSPR